MDPQRGCVTACLAVVMLACRAAAAPVIGEPIVVTPDEIERYARFEIAFPVETAAANPFFPFDPAPPPGVPGGTGITVDALFLPPGEPDWESAAVVPCFLYQPVEEVGSGEDVALLPTGGPEWRCRFTPEEAGTWAYRIRATDAGGASEREGGAFVCAESGRSGFVRVSPTDPRFFERRDGTPLLLPLVNVEHRNPFNSLARIRENVPKFADNGLLFVRWFLSGEGANYLVAPYGDTIRIAWGFGNAHVTPDAADTAAGKQFSFRPYYYTSQKIPAVPGSVYRLSFRALVDGEQVLRREIGGFPQATLDIGSAAGTHHEDNGYVCNIRQDGWHEYAVTTTNDTRSTLSVRLRGLYVSADAPPPFNEAQDGRIRIHSIALRRDETGTGGWGPNLLRRGDPDTHAYVDARSAALLDEILHLSEEHGVCHKLPLFHKNDDVLARFRPDGTVGDRSLGNFYSGDGEAGRWYQHAYLRYFLARWSYSPALHSVELANENDPNSAKGYDAAFAMAQYVRDVSPRPLLVSNSFWSRFPAAFWNDATRKDLMDYCDKHLYARSGEPSYDPYDPVFSRQVDDSAQYVREGWSQFRRYADDYNLQKPILRGEGGLMQAGGWGQDPVLDQDLESVYHRKKLWAHVGALGHMCDGEWWPMLMDDHGRLGMYADYEGFMRHEPLNNGHYAPIGTDLAGTERILRTGDDALRAWGAMDAVAGRAVVWVDNADDTWRRHVEGEYIGTVRGTLTLQGLPADAYRVEFWDTVEGVLSGAGRPTVGADGLLALEVSRLRSDFAVRVHRLERGIDYDGDGMADAWEWEHFGDTRDPDGDAEDDPDGDGSPNAAEERAGTDPRDAESVLRLTAMALFDEGQAALQWTSEAGRAYRVLSAAEPSAEWSVEASALQADPPRNVHFVPISGMQRVYRVGVE